MRIHQILETCVEYVAYDGALGSDPSTLVNHLKKLDSSIDQDYFEHIYGSLVAHPAIQLVVTRHPLQPTDGPILLGTAPLPDDFDIDAASKASLDIERLFTEGVRGRELAFRIAGMDYQTDRETMEANREARRLKAKLVKVKAENARGGPGQPEEALLRFIGRDDKGLGGERILRTDFKGLVAKWGSRFRIRATDDEIYYRLTGTHERNNKVSEKVFLALQLAARARERGISAVELGPAVGASQGSVHYFMKVLKKLGLCAGVPVALPGGPSSLLIFHRFLEQNSVYRAIQRLPPLEDEADAPPPGESADPQSSGPQTPLRDIFLDEDSDDDEQTVVPGDLGIESGPMTESQLVAGHIFKQRLVQLLDHPRLQNHLLGRRNIGPLLGWPHTGVLRHRRAMQRHVDALVHEGTVEIVLVGEKRSRCMRLTKYNPEHDPPTAQEKTGTVELQVSEIPPDEQLLSENSSAFQYQGQGKVTEPMEYQINRLVADSGSTGMTIADVRDRLDNAHRRTVEKHFDRCDNTYVPPHLRDLQICTTLESCGREKRTRAFTVHAYRQLLLEGGAPVNDGLHPPPTEEIGHFSTLENRDLYNDPSEVDQFLNQWLLGATTTRKAVRKRGRSNLNDDGDNEEEDEDPNTPHPPPPPPKKIRRYKNDVQARGRPRKYIHVVREDGVVDRHVVKQLLPHPDLAPIYIHVRSAKKLVPAPEGYTGVGVPPPLDKEAIENGKDYDFFKSYPSKNSTGKLSTGYAIKEEEIDEDDDDDEAAALVEDLVAAPQPEASTSPVEAPPRADEGLTVSSPKKRDGPKQTVVEVTEALPADFVDPVVAPPSDVDQVPSSVEPTTVVEDGLAASPSAIDKDSDATGGSTHRTRKRKPQSPIIQPRSHVQPPTIATLAPEAMKKQKVQESGPSNTPSSTTEQPLTIDLTRVSESITATPSAPPTPVSANPFSTPVSRRVLEGTPLIEITPKIESEITLTKGRVPQRLLLPHLRRMNELTQTLRDLGGVSTTNKLIYQHTEWSKRVAGTDHPHAPAIATQMDRHTFQRTLSGMLEEGRVKQTCHVAPSHTGRYTKTDVLYLPDTSPEVLKAFNRELSVTVSQAYVPVHTPRTLIDDAAFTSVRLPTPTSKTSGSRNVILAVSQSRTSDVGAKDYGNPNLKPEDRRAALLRDPSVISVLCGYISGRFARSALFHRSLIRAMASSPESPSVVSQIPRVFSLELLFTELTVSEWYQLVTCTRYSEELEAFIRDPATKDTKLSDMPAHLRPPGGYGGSKTKNKLRVLLQSLTYFKLVAPLAIVAKDDSSPVVCEGHFQGEKISLKLAPSIGEAMYFRLYEAAPIYHVATDAASLLGVAGIKTIQEATTYWRIAQSACLNQDANSIPRIQHIPLEPGSSAPLTEALEVGVDTLKLLRTKKKWRPDLALLDVQRDALNAFIESERSEGAEKTPEEVDKFAWEYAINRGLVEERLNIRRGKSKGKSNPEGSAQLAALRERKKKAAEELRKKVEAINQDANAEWEKTVKAAAERNGVETSPELTEYLHRYILQSTAVVKRGRLSPDVLDAGCRAFQMSGGRFEETPAVFRRPARGGRRPKLKPAKEPRDPNVKQVRRRKNWSEEDDEMLLDAEAIIRARSAHLPGNKGRQAMVQIFPNVALSVFLSRLKKMWTMPNGQAYFDRLVQAWNTVWVQYRGTEELPDPNPDSLTDFDLNAHVEFLRAKINKSRLRLAAATGAPVPSVTLGAANIVHDLPADIQTLADELVWEESPVKYGTLEAVWESQTNVNRIKDITQIPLVDTDVRPVISASADPRPEVLKAILKAMVATPPSDFLHSYNEHVIAAYNIDEIDKASQELTESKILRKDKPGADGKLYQFQQSWQQSTEGPFPEDLFVEADGLRRVFEDQGGKIEWPIIGKAGETAALMNMMSNHQVEFEVDPTTFPTLIYYEDSFKTRSISDVDIEFPVHVRRTEPFVERVAIEIPPLHAVSSQSTWDVDSEADQSLVVCALEIVRDAGQTGLTKKQIQSTLRTSADELHCVLSTLSKQNIFWAGYDTGRIVHSSFVKGWMVQSHAPIRNDEGRVVDYDQNVTVWAVPRIWTDLFGKQIVAQWETARRNVQGIIISRPGLTERTLRNRLAHILDRLEVNLVLQSLVDSGAVIRTPLHSNGDTSGPPPPICATDIEEENQVVLVPASDKFWN